MPAGDGTGPLGMGPVTGRGMGFCGGYAAPGWAHPGPGRRFFGRGGQGGGGGHGWRHWYYATGLPRWARGGVSSTYAPPTRDQEIEALKGEAEWLKDQLDAINRRMDELSQE
jgi:Family of unknown function (DUF5320)